MLRKSGNLFSDNNMRKEEARASAIRAHKRDTLKVTCESSTNHLFSATELPLWQMLNAGDLHV